MNYTVLKSLGHSYGSVCHITRLDENVRQSAFDTVFANLKEKPEQIGDDVLLKDIWEGLFVRKNQW